MKLVIGADHRGVRYKAIIKEMLEDSGHSVEDLGVHSEKSADYPDQALPVARSVAEGKSERGILVCGTGIGNLHPQADSS